MRERRIGVWCHLANRATLIACSRCDEHDFCPSRPQQLRRVDFDSIVRKRRNRGARVPIVVNHCDCPYPPFISWSALKRLACLPGSLDRGSPPMDSITAAARMRFKLQDLRPGLYTPISVTLVSEWLCEQGKQPPDPISTWLRFQIGQIRLAWQPHRYEFHAWSPGREFLAIVNVCRLMDIGESCYIPLSVADAAARDIFHQAEKWEPSGIETLNALTAEMGHEGMQVDMCTVPSVGFRLRKTEPSFIDDKNLRF